MKYSFLSQKFYTDYPHHLFPEIEQKQNRPYTIICVNLNNHIFALPLRSHIKHPFAYLTDKKNKCGIDFSKAVYISNNRYLDKINKPYIRKNEFDYLKGKEYIIKKKFIKYLQDYVAAQKSLDINKMTSFAYSTLHYFDTIVDYENDILIPLQNQNLITN